MNEEELKKQMKETDEYAEEIGAARARHLTREMVEKSNETMIESFASPFLKKDDHRAYTIVRTSIAFGIMEVLTSEIAAAPEAFHEDMLNAFNSMIKMKISETKKEYEQRKDIESKLEIIVKEITEEAKKNKWPVEKTKKILEARTKECLGDLAGNIQTIIIDQRKTKAE